VERRRSGFLLTCAILAHRRKPGGIQASAAAAGCPIEGCPTIQRRRGQPRVAQCVVGNSRRSACDPPARIATRRNTALRLILETTIEIAGEIRNDAEVIGGARRASSSSLRRTTRRSRMEQDRPIARAGSAAAVRERVTATRFERQPSRGIPASYAASRSSARSTPERPRSKAANDCLPPTARTRRESERSPGAVRLSVRRKSKRTILALRQHRKGG